MCMLACGGRRGGADFADFVQLLRGLRFIILMAEGRSFGGAAEGAKGGLEGVALTAKVLHLCFWGF